MDWHDTGILLSVLAHGETSVVASILTRDHGRHAGLVRGGASRRMVGVMQPGNALICTWRARLIEHLGNYRVELVDARAARLLDRGAPLAALSAACALLDALVPEREPHVRLYDATSALFDALDETEDWPAAYVMWELGLLAELGFGIDLSVCAVTGSPDGLSWVSPKSGRAVSAAVGEPYRDRLLPLPGFLLGRRSVDVSDISDGLRLTGHFLGRCVRVAHGHGLPAARDRLVGILRRETSNSCDKDPS